MNIQSTSRGDLPRIAATLNKVLKSDARGAHCPGFAVLEVHHAALQTPSRDPQIRRSLACERGGHRARGVGHPGAAARAPRRRDRKSTRLNSSHSQISYAVFCLKKTLQH